MADNKKNKIFGLFERSESYYIPAAEQKDTQRLLEYCQKSYPVSCIVGAEGTGRTAAAFWVYLSLPYATHEVIYISKINPGKDSLLKSILQLFGQDNLEGLSTRDLFKKAIEESEDILNESRNLLIIVDDPAQFNAEVWREQFEPLLAINNIQEGSFSFLITMSSKTEKELSEKGVFDPDVRLQKEYLPRNEMKAYLETRLKNSSLQDLMINDEELNLIYQKSNGHFARVNELASISFQRIAHLAGEIKEEKVVKTKKPPLPKPKPIPEEPVASAEDLAAEMSPLQSVVDHAPIEKKKTGGVKIGNIKIDDKTQIRQAPVTSTEDKKDKGSSSDDSWKIIESLLKSS